MDLLIQRDTQRGPVILLDPQMRGKALLHRFANLQLALPVICNLFGEAYDPGEDLAKADEQITKLERQHEHDLQVIDLLEADKEELKEKVQKLLLELEGAQG